MKITTNPSEPTPEYPKLMQSGNGNVYLMLQKRIGVRLKTVSGCNVGVYCTSLVVSDFKPYTGSITLEN